MSIIRPTLARPGTRAALLTLLVASAACQSAPTTVALEMEARLEGNDLHVTGSTDLPDGALLAYEVRHERYGHDPETPEYMIFTAGVIEVTNGIFDHVVDLSRFDPGEIDVSVSFQMSLDGGAEQPAFVRSRFGSRGERLTGPNVSQLETGERHVAIVATVHR